MDRSRSGLDDNRARSSKTIQAFKRGDLIRISEDDVLGIVTYQHPTKGVARVYWPDVGFSWESISRLSLISHS